MLEPCAPVSPLIPCAPAGPAGPHCAGTTDHDCAWGARLPGLASNACGAGRTFYTGRAGHNGAWSALLSDWTSRARRTGGAIRTGRTDQTGPDRLRSAAPHGKQRGAGHR